MSRYFLGGMNGVGKSTLTRAIQERDPSMHGVHTASLMMDHLGIARGDYDSLRAYPDEYKLAQNGIVLANRLQRAITTNEHVILDSHYLNIVRGNVSPLFSGEWPRLLAAFVLVTSSVELIQQRLVNDRLVRDRQLVPDDLSPRQERYAIQVYLQQTESEFSRLCSLYDRPGLIIHNTASISAAVDQFMVFDGQVRRQYAASDL